MSKKQDIAKEVLKANAYISEVHVTSDNKPFLVISDAQNYAKKFKNTDDRKVTTFNREDLKVVATVKKERKVALVKKDITDAKSVKEVQEIIKNEYRPFLLAFAKIKIKEYFLDTSVENQGDFKEVISLNTKVETLKAKIDTLEKNSSKDQTKIGKLETSNKALIKKVKTDKSTIEKKEKELKKVQSENIELKKSKPTENQ